MAGGRENGRKRLDLAVIGAVDMALAVHQSGDGEVGAANEIVVTLVVGNDRRFIPDQLV